MKRDGPARTDEVLRLVRGSSDPLPSEEQALWSRLEHRLAMSSVPPASHAGAWQRRARAGEKRGASSGPTRLPLSLAGSLPRLALWAAFGVSMAAIGYGVAARERALPAQSALSAPLERVPVQPSLPGPAPALPLPEAPPVPELRPVPEAIPRPVNAAAPGAVVVPVRAAHPAPASRGADVMPKRPAPALPVVVPFAKSLAHSPAPVVVEAAPVEVRAPEPLRLREALQFLERARAAVRLGTAGDALDWLDQLERRNPGALLEQERLVTRALALCALNDVARARALRERLERLDPQSIYRGQLATSCAKKD